MRLCRSVREVVVVDVLVGRFSAELMMLVRRQIRVAARPVG